MPGFLLNLDSQVLCAHGGTGKAAVALPRVKIMGKPAVGGTVTPYAIAGCPFQQPTVPPTPSPCTMAVNWQPRALRVKAMNLSVLLSDGKAMCLPNGVPTTAIPVQARVKGT